MKIAYLIIAHHQPFHLAKLIKCLTSDSAYFFIHIDKKSCISDFQVLIPENDRVVFLGNEHRINVHWSGFNEVTAILKLVKAALGSELQMDRFCLLTGSDFPIKKVSYIEEQLSTEKEFIHINVKLNDSDDNEHCKFIRYYWFADNFLLRKTHISGKIRRKIYDNIDLYQGSAWWALTRQCVEYIAEFSEHNKDYIRFHKYTLCPDEIFFNSIVKFSPFAKNITHDIVRYQNNLEYSNKYSTSNEFGCHYIDWSDPRAASPKVLNLNDLDNIMRSRALFARKFDEKKSKDLIDIIETEIS